MKGLASRKIAVEILLKVEQEGAFAKDALSNAFKQHSLQERDRAFVTFIVQGTLRHMIELDEELKALSKIPLKKISAPLKATLRTGLFQLMHMKDTPASAVINTSVEIARKTGHEGSAKFANGILRAFSRKLAAPAKQEENPDAALETRLSKRYSLPEWLISRWLKRFGEEECSQILEYAQKIPKLTLRCCQTGISTEGLKTIFENKGMTIEISPLMPACINIIDRGSLGGPLSKLPGYEEGLFTVQDDASALVGLILAPKQGWTIVDLCAAPGGKSFHLGELMENKGRIIAVDSSEKRLSLIARERRRLGLTNIEAVVADGRSFKPDAPCDAVLVDAPCSGTGVINRRSDLRQHREEAQIGTLVEMQKALLNNAASMLKIGAVLVYSTCSMEYEENEENVLWFKNEHPEFRLDNLTAYFAPELIERWSSEAHWAETRKQLETGYIQLLPSRHGCSGFFISRFVREQ